MVKNGCSFGQVSREMIQEIRHQINKFETNMDKKMTELFNHQSDHVSPDIVNKIELKSRIITILTGVLCAAIGVVGAFMIIK